MNTKIYNLFVAGGYHAEAGMIHAAASIYGDNGQPAGRVTMSLNAGDAKPGFEPDHAAGLAAFEIGCVMAKQAGMSKVLLHAPDSVDHDVMYLGREDPDMPVDEDGGVDYFNMGVFVYRPGENAGIPAWRRDAWDKTRAAVSGLMAAAQDAVL